MTPKKIAFLSNKLTLRGAEVALYDYAHYNEILLKNKSIIITRPFEETHYERDVDIKAYEKFKERFEVIYYSGINQDRSDQDRGPNYSDQLNEIVLQQKLDFLYVIRGGHFEDGLFTTIASCKNIHHLVFSTQYLNIFARNCVISEAINDKSRERSNVSTNNASTNVVLPVVPHIIQTHPTEEDLRDVLGIPHSATVFGTYSGSDPNHEYILQTIHRVLHVNNPNANNMYFIFMNIQPFIDHPRVFFCDGTANAKAKKMFINTCDAMLYMRALGETFGLAIGEFQTCDKPIILSRHAQDKFHFQVLGEDGGIYHSNSEELYKILMTFSKTAPQKIVEGYKKYTPEYVMSEFQKYFLE